MSISPFSAQRVRVAVPGVRLGHTENLDAKTGVTVFLFDEPFVCAGAMIGKATSTRQADSLRPDHVVEKADAFCFTGGSAFGLDATGGVLRYLEEQGRGAPTRYGPVPIVPTAALYDLGLGSFTLRADAAMAYDACRAASTEPFAQGSVGVGCGATIGKLFGVDQSMKGGLGSVIVEQEGMVVQAVVANNGFGDVIDPAFGTLIAGARMAPDSLELADTQKALCDQGFSFEFMKQKKSPQNTVLCAVLTNARLSKQQAFELAQDASQGLGLALRPAFVPFDGDVVFVAASGEKPVPEGVTISEMAKEAVAKAAVQGVMEADGFGLLPAYRDLLNAGM